MLQCALLLSPVLYTRDNTYFFEFLFLWFWGCESKSLFLHQQTLSWIEMQGFHSCHCCGIECAKSWQIADVFQAESSLQCEEIFPLVQKKFLSFQKMMQNSGFYIAPYKYKCLYVSQWTRGITVLPVCSYKSTFHWMGSITIANLWGKKSYSQLGSMLSAIVQDGATVISTPYPPPPTAVWFTHDFHRVTCLDIWCPASIVWEGCRTFRK